MSRFPNRRASAVEHRNQLTQLLKDRDQSNFPLESAGTPFSSPVLVAQGEYHSGNGDQETFAKIGDYRYLGSFTKGLRHDVDGVAPEAGEFYKLLDTARRNNDVFAALETNSFLAGPRKHVNPAAALAFDPTGADTFDLTCPPAPPVISECAAAEMVELYWMALARDVPFTRYGAEEITAQAATELGDPDMAEHLDTARPGGLETPATLFRGSTGGDLAGPYISQFLLKPVPYGTLTIDQRQQTALAGRDYMTSFDAWLSVQNGAATAGMDAFDAQSRYINTLRDLATYVHFDQLHEAYFNAALILSAMKIPNKTPYQTATGQSGFGTLGGPHLLVLVTEIATRALKTVWLQKWFVHRRLRPEEFGGRLEVLINRQVAEEIFKPLLLQSNALQTVRERYGNVLLPQAFPEGSPMHPAYGAGHATVAGACVTILKAWFEENAIVPDPVVATDDGLRLAPHPGVDLTVGGELDKLAANIAIGRNGAGVHWRSDYTKSVALGEAVAVSMLQDLSISLPEKPCFSFTSFSGRQITVKNGTVAAGPCLPDEALER